MKIGMKRTLRKYNKKTLINKKTIKLRHKKYIGGVKKPRVKPVLKIVEEFSPKETKKIEDTNLNE